VPSPASDSSTEVLPKTKDIFFHLYSVCRPDSSGALASANFLGSAPYRNRHDRPAAFVSTLSIASTFAAFQASTVLSIASLPFLLESPLRCSQRAGAAVPLLQVICPAPCLCPPPQPPFPPLSLFQPAPTTDRRLPRQTKRIPAPSPPNPCVRDWPAKAAGV